MVAPPPVEAYSYRKSISVLEKARVNRSFYIGILLLSLFIQIRLVLYMTRSVVIMISEKYKDAEIKNTDIRQKTRLPEREAGLIFY